MVSHRDTEGTEERIFYSPLCPLLENLHEKENVMQNYNLGKKLAAVILASLLIISMFIPALCEDQEEQLLPYVPTHKTGEFRDMDVPTFLSEIGPGYSDLYLSLYDPTIVLHSKKQHLTIDTRYAIF